MQRDKERMMKSTVFWNVVSAHALRWNRDGKIKAIGTQVKAPTIEMNLSSLSPKAIVIPMVINTKIVLVTFLDIYLFFDFGHPA